MSNFVGKCGSRNAEGGMPDGRPLRARPSAFRNPPSAITLIEVLISMGVLTLGILGVAALFPVGSYYAQRGDIYDRADAAAASALSDAVTRGMVDPERWVSYHSMATMGGLLPSYVPPGGAPGRFTRPFALDLRQRQALLARDTTSLFSLKQAHVIQESGSIYFIDPIGAARGINFDTNNGTLYAADARLGAAPASLKSTAPAFLQASVAAGAAKQFWTPWIGKRPILRVTLDRNKQATNPARPLSVTGAENLAALTDDLVFDLGDNPDQPSRQQWLTSGSAPLGRMARGNFDYLISVVPRGPRLGTPWPTAGGARRTTCPRWCSTAAPPTASTAPPRWGGSRPPCAPSGWPGRVSRPGTPGGGEVRLYQDSWAPDSLTTGNPADELPGRTSRRGATCFCLGLILTRRRTSRRLPRRTGPIYLASGTGWWRLTTRTRPARSAPALALRGPTGRGSELPLRRD